jgi:hypothetical protein
VPPAPPRHLACLCFEKANLCPLLGIVWVIGSQMSDIETRENSFVTIKIYTNIFSAIQNYEFPLISLFIVFYSSALLCAVAMELKIGGGCS